MVPLKPPPEGHYALALAVVGLAGWVDAVGLVGSGRVFVSFMSGNTTRMAMSLVHGQWGAAGAVGVIVLLFVAGVVAGEIVSRMGGTAWVLGCEAVLLALGAALQAGHRGGLVHPVLWALVFAMGLQNATLHRTGGLAVGLTYVTGTLVHFGRSLASLLSGTGGAPRLVRYLGLWLSLVVGACCGTAALAVSAAGALGLAAALAVGVAVVSAIVVRTVGVR